MRGALIGIDIGATSIKAGAFDERGEPLVLASRSNGPVPQDGVPGWFVWDTDRLWANVASAVREVVTSLPSGSRPLAVAVTGFGADGAPFAPDGRQRYPVISWHDARAQEDQRAIVEQIGERRLYELTGYHAYPINTLCRWRWLARNEPDALVDATWLMVPDIVAFRLCGEQRTDPTSASTTMAFGLAAAAWSTELLGELSIPFGLPAEVTLPGAQLGEVTSAAAAETGLPEGLPVVAAGHDAEIVALAAGSLPDGTALDVSGTWEIVMIRHERFQPDDAFFDNGIDWEVDATPGRYLCLALMPSGSVVNWLRELAYAPGVEWSALADDARSVPIGANGISVVPAFVRGMGPYGRTAASGSLAGLQTTTTRAEISRAVFEALCLQLRSQLRLLERLHLRPLERLRVCGGAQRNSFWLQLKADTTGCVAEAVQHEELTLLGAALLAGVGSGVYGSVDDAIVAAERRPRLIEPDPVAAAAYAELFASREHDTEALPA
jgi:sugar (pentulose or hexulose) kinase